MQNVLELHMPWQICSIRPIQALIGDFSPSKSAELNVLIRVSRPKSFHEAYEAFLRASFIVISDELYPVDIKSKCTLQPATA
jgi:hypothetical protein